MSNTALFIKRHFGGAWFSIALYIINSICLVVGAAMLAMKFEDWSGMWWMQKLGWSLLLIGNVTNTWKAATSASTRKEITQ